jgi:hypothetical protein
MGAALKAEPQYLAPSELSERWQGKITTQTLAQWRARKVGPAYTKLGGSVLYDLADVEAYEAKQRRGGQ